MNMQITISWLKVVYFMPFNMKDPVLTLLHNDLGPIMSLLQRNLQPSTLNFMDDVVSHKKAIELRL